MKEIEQTITTVEIAEMMETEHYKILEKLEGTKDKKTKGVIPTMTAHEIVVSDYFTESTYKDASGKENKCYKVTKIGCDFLANKFTGEKGIIFTAKYVKKFSEMQNIIQNNLPTGKNLIALAVIEAQKLIDEKDKLLEEQKPKVIFADAVSTSNTSILVGDLAKIIKQNGVDIGAQRLFIWLRDNGYLIKRKGCDWNMPTQTSMDLKLFEIKESTHLDGNGCNVTTKTPKVTGKGQQYFINKLLEKGA